jgi:cellulose synthase/poly-beta-1,6-N-acetylglucosamine synthase-like glycosyltransferase
MHRRRASKSARLYTVVVLVWVALMYPLVIATRPIADSAFHRNTVIGILVIITMLFISYFWLNGLKDVMYPAAYRLRLARGLELPRPRHFERRIFPVGLLYCTCNDFNAESLLASMQQDYPGCFTVILDDSSDPGMIAAVDEFASHYGVRVSRRPNRLGFKAGNLNWFLQGNEMDYFVILDSDEIIPSHFVSRCLDYFASNPAIGIVQANHVATRNRNTFMRTFAPGVDSHWPAYQVVKATSGFMSLLGHGAMVDLSCYDAAGGFPMLVAEDICFAIEARNAGWLTVFAPDITCEEEFPVDYAAFKKRHRKWTEGNMEFIRKFSWKILTGRMRWFEKLDIVLFTYSLPLTGIFSLYVITNAIVFPLAGFRYHYPPWMLIPTTLFLIAPLLNDVLTYIKQPKAKLLSYLLHSIVLFGSMYFVSLHASIKSALGKSVFHVTPKTAGRGGLRVALRQNMREIIFAVMLSAVVAWAAGSVLPVVLLVIPIAFSVYLAVMNTGDSVSSHRDGSHDLMRGGVVDDRVLPRTAMIFEEPDPATQWAGIESLLALAVTEVPPAIDHARCQ